jgi:hypothetical protein
MRGRGEENVWGTTFLSLGIIHPPEIITIEYNEYMNGQEIIAILIRGKRSPDPLGDR